MADEPQVAYDAGDESQVRSRKKTVKLKTDQSTEELRLLLENKSFRSFLWRQLEFCKIFQESFTGNSTTFYNEGRRSVGLNILDAVFKANAGAFIMMQQEAQNDGE